FHADIVLISLLASITIAVVAITVGFLKYRNDRIIQANPIHSDTPNNDLYALDSENPSSVEHIYHSIETPSGYEDQPRPSPSQDPIFHTLPPSSVEPWVYYHPNNRHIDDPDPTIYFQPPNTTFNTSNDDMYILRPSPSQDRIFPTLTLPHSSNEPWINYHPNNRHSDSDDTTIYYQPPNTILTTSNGDMYPRTRTLMSAYDPNWSLRCSSNYFNAGNLNN
ncbi:unnamed protein product, partial [Owenia fusiformis]